MDEDCGPDDDEHENSDELIHGIFLHWVWVTFGCGLVYHADK